MPALSRFTIHPILVRFTILCAALMLAGLPLSAGAQGPALRPSISGVQKLRVPAGTSIAAIRSGDLVVTFRQQADGAAVRLESGRAYHVSFR